MKKLFSFLFVFAIYVAAAQTKAPAKKTAQNSKSGSYKVTKVLPEKSINPNETRLVITFLGPTNAPARNNVKFVLNEEDSIFPVIDVNGHYSVEIDPGEYKMRFEVPFWYSISTDKIVCKKQTTTNITVKFEAKVLK
jgi:hypothetical protein